MKRSNLNPLHVDQLAQALEGPVRPRRGKPRSIAFYTAKLARVVRKAPEVLVKVSGSGKSRAHTLAHLTYITRNGKLEAENERGQRIAGLAAVKEVFGEWGFQTPGDSERKRAQTVNLVLSMPKGTDAKAVLDAARSFASETFSSNHQYLLAFHDDTDHPHVHLAVKVQGFDLTWLRRNKADLQDWRESFAEKLRDRGVEAEATPRRARGVVQKPQTQSMRHLVQEKRSRVLRAKVNEAILALAIPEKVLPSPWEIALRERQRQLRQVYLVVASELRQSDLETTRKAAGQLDHFLKGLPPLETERQRLQRDLAGTYERMKRRGPVTKTASERTQGDEPERER